MSTLYHVTPAELAAFDREVQEIRAAIARTPEETQRQVDRTQLWVDATLSSPSTSKR